MLEMISLEIVNPVDTSFRAKVAIVVDYIIKGKPNESS
jgi:hypothetical protein